MLGSISDEERVFYSRPCILTSFSNFTQNKFHLLYDTYVVHCTAIIPTYPSFFFHKYLKITLIYSVPCNQKMLKFAAEIDCILLAFSFSGSGNNFPCDPHKQIHSTDHNQQRVRDAVWMYLLKIWWVHLRGVLANQIRFVDKLFNKRNTLGARNYHYFKLMH